MQSEEREQAIINVLAQRRGFLAFHDIEKRVQASAATLRRDLERMARDGRIKRIRGGAKLVVKKVCAPESTPSRLVGVPFRDNIARHRTQKEAIGRAAAALCAPDTAISIGGGSTTLQMCRHLGGMNLQVLTNSLHVVMALTMQVGTRVLVPGGTVFREQNLILSTDREETAPQAKAAKLFIGAASVGAQGVMQADPFLTAAERRLIEGAEELVLLVDSSKFQGSGNIICELQEVDIVVTDPGITNRDRAMLRAAGIKVVIAK